MTNRRPDPVTETRRGRLDSWKEIADYLARDVRTAIRWEQERGLPVYRVPGGKRTTVFSYTHEIEAWLVSHSEIQMQQPEEPSTQENGASLAVTSPRLGSVVDADPETKDKSVERRRTLYYRAAFLVVVVAGCLVVLGWWLVHPPLSPKVRGYVQITQDGELKRGPLASDGANLYFTELLGSGPTIVAVPLTGGQPAPVSPAWNGLALQDIAPDGREILAQAVGGTVWEKQFSILPLPAGQPRHLGVVGREGRWSPDGKRLAFANGDGLYIAKNEGTDARRLVTVAGKVRNPHWSRDGTDLRFGIQEEVSGTVSLWEISATGGNLHSVAAFRTDSGGFWGNWTMNGKYDVFGSGPGTWSNIWAIGETAGLFGGSSYETFQLTNGPIAFSCPLPSRTGKKLLAIGDTGRMELVRYDPQSRQYLPYLGGIPASQVAFSPDGQWVVYTLLPGDTVWKSKVDGSERLQLTFAPLRALSPRWSPDGNSIVFAGSTSSARGRWNIYRISRGGGSPERVVPADADQSHPGWSPDGRSLVFSGAPWLYGFSPESTAISVFDFRKRQVSTLTGSRGLWSPRWSPSGRYIVTETVDSQKLMLLDLRSRQWADLASAQAIDCTAWSHDGRYVYFNTYSATDHSVYRVPVSGGKEELVLSLDGLRVAEPFGHWFGLTPDDALLIQRDNSISEVYALDVDWP